MNYTADTTTYKQEILEFKDNKFILTPGLFESLLAKDEHMIGILKDRIQIYNQTNSTDKEMNEEKENKTELSEKQGYSEEFELLDMSIKSIGLDHTSNFLPALIDELKILKNKDQTTRDFFKGVYTTIINEALK